jgi:hypothetical protein
MEYKDTPAWAGLNTPFTCLEESNGQYSFLPAPIFSPTWPTKGTLADKALALFMEGRLIDHPHFEALTGSWRLGAVVFQLRELRWPIETLDIASPTEDMPDRIIALYRLDGSFIGQAIAMQNNGGSL